MIRRHMLQRIRIAAIAVMLLAPRLALAQVGPAAAKTPPDDTPSVKVGVTIFADYTLSTAPKVADAAGDTVRYSAFNVGRAYINVTGNVSHLMAFRVTPDIARESGAGSSLSGSLIFRLKYAFAQFNLDDWLPKGTWVRLGLQQTPWIDFEEGAYRYRFQGPVFSDREGLLSSADAGVSAHLNLPSNYGDVHVGVYNGETYSKAETNNQKALQVRASLRPFARGAPLLRGLRASIFHDADHYVDGSPRTRTIGALTFENPHLHLGAQTLSAKDQTLPTKPRIDAKGYSFWAVPRTAMGIEGLIRYDHLTPNKASDTQQRNRLALGLAYWLPHQGSPSSAVMIDYETTSFENFSPAQPDQDRIALRVLINF